MTKWGKITSLSLRELWIMVLALFFLPLSDLLLNLFGYIRLHRMIEKFSPIQKERQAIAESIPIMKSIARMVSIAASHGVYHATCLRKSLVVLWFLRRQKMAGVIRFGVRLINNNLEAHAWVEWQGIVVNDEPDVRERFSLLEGNLPDIKAGL